MGREIFRNSQELRNQIISQDPEKPEDLISLSVAYFWPTKYCPIGCEHCMFASPKLNKVDRKMILSETAVNNFIKISKDANLESLVVSGGGEPTLEMDTIEKLLGEANFKYFEIITGAQWTAKEGLVHKYLGRLQNAITKRKEAGGEFNFSLRVSIDSFHQRVVKLDKIANLVNILREDSKKKGDKMYPDIKIFFRTLLVDGENTADELARYLGADISDLDHYVRKITFEGDEDADLNNLLVFYKDMRYVGRAKGAWGINKSVEFDNYFESYAKNQGDIRLGMSYLRPGSEGEALNGINVFVSYDGKMMPYGGAPDVSLNINEEDDFSAYSLKLMRDVVSKTLLLKGIRHIEEVAEEVEPNIRNKIEQKNWLASVADESLATSELRLYVTIRLLQKSIQNDELNISALPDWLQDLINMPVDSLIDEYNKHTKDNPPQRYTYGSEMVDINVLPTQ